MLRRLHLEGGGASPDRINRELQRLGCPASQAASVMDLLVDAELLELHPIRGEATATELGRHVSSELQAGRWEAYASVLLNLQWAKQQIVAAVRLMRRDSTSILLDDVTRLTAVAPQVAVILSWTRASSGRTVRLPDSLLEQIHFGESPATIPEWVKVNASVGARAEQYSLHFERSRKAPGVIFHVASDSDRYGYDIEDRSRSPRVAIEVKGSTSESVAFFLSAHELATARTLGPRYVLHFWGGIDLRRHMSTEYSHLRGRGYPIIKPGLGGALEQGEFEMSPSAWRVRAVE